MLIQNVQFEQSHNVVVVSVALRELTAVQMQELVDALMEKMRCDNAQHFIFDLAQVEFISSACLGSMVSFLQDLEHVRGRIALVRCRPEVQFLFKVTKLDAIFHLCDDEDEARALLVSDRR